MVIRSSFHTGADADRIAAWVAAGIPGCERGFGPCTAMSIWDDQAIIGGVVFHNYSPETGVMEMSAAASSPRWLTKDVLHKMHRYIFDEAGCQMAVMRVAESNLRMRRIAERFGYRGHKIPRLRGRGEAEIIFTLADDQRRLVR